MTAKKATSHSGRGGRKHSSDVHQFLVVLSGTDPLVWRRIEVPEEYSFWDLHVAIQDAMGWLDYHLHEFLVVHAPSGSVERIGIPDGEVPEDKPCTPGWKAKVSDYFALGASPALYVYDFGDDWQHVLMHEGTAPADESVSYPRCMSGARRCPPEDCGGAHGYTELLAAIADPEHPDYEELLEWLGGNFDPDDFDAASVTFDDPRVRWKTAFEE
jgi:hypothetical protein